MFEKITAIAAAAACAGLIVAFAPGFAPEVVAGTSQPVEFERDEDLHRHPASRIRGVCC